jgi:hypothetical protein
MKSMNRKTRYAIALIWFVMFVRCCLCSAVVGQRTRAANSQNRPGAARKSAPRENIEMTVWFDKQCGAPIRS